MRVELLGLTRRVRIATYNVNGIKSRLPRLLEWLAEQQPDVACLQELKTTDETFPEADIRAAGYGAIWHGQKAFNGVAILTKERDPVERQRGLPGDPDDVQSRYLEAEIDGVIVASIYLPNGNPLPGPKFDYKLAWFERLNAHARALLALEEPLVLCGDYNVIPEPQDARNPAAWVGDALFQPDMLGDDLGRLVDVGTGTGRILELLGPQAAQAIGIDVLDQRLLHGVVSQRAREPSPDVGLDFLPWNPNLDCTVHVELGEVPGEEALVEGAHGKSPHCDLETVRQRGFEVDAEVVEFPQVAEVVLGTRGRSGAAVDLHCQAGEHQSRHQARVCVWVARGERFRLGQPLAHTALDELPHKRIDGVQANSVGQDPVGAPGNLRGQVAEP